MFYMGNVLLHLFLGLFLIPLAAVLVWKQKALTIPAAAFAVAAGIGVYLMIHGNLRSDQPVLIAHIVAAVAAVAFLLPFLARQSRLAFGWTSASFAALCLLPLLAFSYHRIFPNPHDRIRNPMIAPAGMEEEGGGPKSPFWPSSIQTNVRRQIPAGFFLDSAKCGECHKEIYEQWRHSAHHFASFNNQFYRKAIEYMQDVQHSTPAAMIMQ
jgi:hypothetical protein